MSSYRKETDCHLSPVMHLISSTSGYWSISGCNPYPAATHLQLESISYHLSPAVIHPQPWSSWFEPSISSMDIITLVWSAFRDFSSSSVSCLKIIVTDVHNIHLPLTFHRSPIIRWHIIHYKKIPTHWSVHMPWDLSVPIHDPASWASDPIPCNCRNTTPLDKS